LSWGSQSTGIFQTAAFLLLLLPPNNVKCLILICKRAIVLPAEEKRELKKNEKEQKTTCTSWRIGILKFCMTRRGERCQPVQCVSINVFELWAWEPKSTQPAWTSNHCPPSAWLYFHCLPFSHTLGHVLHNVNIYCLIILSVLPESPSSRTASPPTKPLPHLHPAPPASGKVELISLSLPLDKKSRNMGGEESMSGNP